jgi:hypothetical protein
VPITGGVGTGVDSDMVIMTFRTLVQTCGTPNLVKFRPHVPPSRLTNALGGDIAILETNLPAITIDDTEPVIDCPDNLVVNADAGFCSTTLSLAQIGTATATDNCTAAPTITWVRSDGAIFLDAPFTLPLTTITWTATDGCGNFSTCNQTVTKSNNNVVNVAVQLSPNIDAVGILSRCITFELWECPDGPNPTYAVSQIVNFTVTPGAPNVALGNTTLLVPCNAVYTCMTARDDLHTLRRTDEGFGPVGVNYVGDFTGNPSLGGDWLVGGNLNDDLYIDILDFGVYVGQYLVNYGTGNTDCLLTTFPHADITGNGTVNTGDFTFIQANFLKLSEPNCCGNLNDERALAVGPVTRISVKELIRRGMPELVRADLNRDGWLDTQDIATFINNGGQP